MRVTIEAELESQRRRNDKMNLDIVNLTADFTLKIEKKDMELAELRTELKLRAYEITSTGIALEEKSALLREQSLELERVREEQKAYRAAFIQLEEEYNTEKYRLQLELAELMSKQKMISNLEIQQQQSTTTPEKSHDYNDIMKLKEDLKCAEITETNLRKELFEVRELLSLATTNSVGVGVNDSSRTYLITKLRDSEKLASDTLNRLHVTEKRLNESEKKLDECNRNLQQQTLIAEEAKERLGNLLQQRSEVDELRQILMSLRNDDMNSSSNLVNHTTFYPEDVIDTDRNNPEGISSELILKLLQSTLPITSSISTEPNTSTIELKSQSLEAIATRDIKEVMTSTISEYKPSVAEAFGLSSSQLDQILTTSEGRISLKTNLDNNTKSPVLKHKREVL